MDVIDVLITLFMYDVLKKLFSFFDADYTSISKDEEKLIKVYNEMVKERVKER